jgi:carbon storage regulator
MMLVLTRKTGERILIGPDIELTLVEVRGKRVRLGVSAPQELPVHREEVRRRINESLLATDDAAVVASRVPGAV